jgi:hypothetical protein
MPDALAQAVADRVGAKTSTEFVRARARERVLREWQWLDEHAEEWLPTALQESTKTAGYSVTPSPFSRSKTSNWIARLGGLPAYIQNVAKGIMKSGKSESEAIASAIAVMKRWAAGGGKVSAEVKAAAAKALSQWEALKAKNATKKGVKAAA